MIEKTIISGPVSSNAGVFSLVKLDGVVEDTAVELFRLSVTRLPEDVKEALAKAEEKETSEVARKQLEAILLNVRLAEESGRPVCQDTGMPNIYLKAGDRFPVLGALPGILRRAVRRATKAVPLRPNAVSPLTRINSGDNTGEHIPYLNWSIVGGDSLEMSVLPKGGGSENMCSLKMLSPSQGMKGIKQFVVDSVFSAGGQPCPPTILGVGIGGGADIAMKIAKLAIMRPLDRRHPDNEIAKLEEELLELVNETGVGPMGLGGRTTSLGVNVEWAHCHTASLPVALAFQCWAARRATARITRGGRVRYLTHRRQA